MSSEDEKDNSAVHSGQHSDMCLMLAGFEDCAAEALRYLIVEEGFASDHPVVQGLKEHLEIQKRHLDLQSVIGSYLEAVDRETRSVSGLDRDEELADSSHFTEDFDEHDEEFLRMNYESSWTILMQSDEFLSKIMGHAVQTTTAVSDADTLSNSHKAPSPSPSI